MKKYVLLLMLMLDTSLGQHVQTVEKQMPLAVVPFSTNYNEFACSNIVVDKSGSDCITWKALSTQSYNAQNNIGKWITSGTKIKNSNESISINGAPAGIVPDLYHTYIGNIGGILSRRRVKTTVYVDRMSCLNTDCTWVGDSRYVVDRCDTLAEGLNVTDVFDQSVTCQAKQWVMNKLRGTPLAVGRNSVLDSSIKRDTKYMKYVEVSRNVRVKHPVADKSIMLDIKSVRYYKDDNRTSFLGPNYQKNNSDIDIRPEEDPLASIKDSTMHAILSNLYDDIPGLVIRAIEINGQCRPYALKSLYCDSKTVRSLYLEQALLSKPVIDSCDYNASAPVTSLLASSSEVLSMVCTELFDLYNKGIITNETISVATKNGTLNNDEVIDLLLPRLQSGFNTSILYQLGARSYLKKYSDVPLFDNTTELVEIAIGKNSSVACFLSNNISSSACVNFNADQRYLEPDIMRQFNIIENNGNMWLEFDMSNSDNYYSRIPTINWNGLFDFINRDTICITGSPDNSYGKKEVERWYNAMETLVHPASPNNLFRTEAEPGVATDCISTFDSVGLIEDFQYIADLIVENTNNALQSVSPTMTHVSAAISVAFVLLSSLALVLTFEHKHTHTIAVITTLLVLLASIGVLLADNLNTQSQNNQFLNDAIILEKFPATRCQTSYPLYISAISQTYVGDRYANVILWIGVGLVMICMIVTVIYIVISKKRRSAVKFITQP